MDSTRIIQDMLPLNSNASLPLLNPKPTLDRTLAELQTSHTTHTQPHTPWRKFLAWSMMNHPLMKSFSRKLSEENYVTYIKLRHVHCSSLICTHTGSAPNPHCGWSSNYAWLRRSTMKILGKGSEFGSSASQGHCWVLGCGMFIGDDGCC